MNFSKIIYLVRHGESEGNISDVVQPPDSPLSAKGVRQAKFIAKRVSHLKFDLLISSPYKRAKQTAEIISELTGKPYVVNELFYERRAPKRLQGASLKEKKTRFLLKEWERTLYTSGTKFEDGENFDEVSLRVQKALSFLKERKEKSIVVVTHGFFIRFLTIKAILQESLTGEIFKKFWFSTQTINTGITVLKYYDKYFESKNHWVLLTFNDHAHLGE